MLELSYPHLDVRTQDDVATVTLNRPEVHNAFNEDLMGEITDCFERLSRDERVRVVVLTGAGKSFCAGGDLNWMAKSIKYTKKQNLEDAKRLSQMLHAVNECPKAVVARVHGNALGGGSGLVAACDMVIASETAQFGFTEVKLGIVPAAIAPFVIAKIGESHARARFMAGDRFSAHVALHIDLIHQVAPADQLDTRVDEAIRNLRSSGPRAMGEAKALIREVIRNPEGADKICVETIARLRVGQEGQEGLKAFLEKRKPIWVK